MFHAFDSGGGGGSAPAQPPQRASWMALLARAPEALLAQGLGERAEQAIQWLRPPETGLVMVQGRAGGTGERFNLGETTVTRCALRCADGGPMGVAYIMGRSHRQARLAALADAWLQRSDAWPEGPARLLPPIQAWLAAQRQQQGADAQATRVDFFTVARESDGPDDEDDDA